MNPWISFSNLLSKDKRTIAQVQSTNAVTGRVSVIQVGGINITHVESNGSEYANNTYVFVEGGVIVGQAPNIRNVAIELLM